MLCTGPRTKRFETYKSSFALQTHESPAAKPGFLLLLLNLSQTYFRFGR